ncbi:TVP38/TMEM64 family protein [Hymenobacter fodinae]|uniref:TVP38/TMEM64 family membrane protein n=1 Tax=Hymenobacter fodinae TaxID=2510796 RepID=A0A4Z0P4F5_9BACT|nr:TVP38/TMEM64 family protein [Hymenobacter fodinae]TGE06161.1 TVP38/TMEM64 family protein [Hymenobacter fodinae]
MTSTTTQAATAPKRSSRTPLYGSIVLVAALLACWFFWPAFQAAIREAYDVLSSGEQERISTWMHQFGFWGPIVLVLAMVVQMFLFVINVVLLILVAILAYGPWWGSLLALVGVVLASSVGYGLGHLLGESFVAKVLGQKAERKMIDIVQRYGVWAVVIARLSPALSDDAISFVAGLARMGYLKFITATVAGVVPLIALLAYLGENSQRLKTGLLWVTGVSLLLFGGYIWWDKRRTKKNKST